MRNFKLQKLFFFILLLSSVLICCNPIYASLNNKLNVYEEYTPESISSFIKDLVNNGEYYRAHVELGRLAGYYPGFLSPLCYNVTDLYILFKSGLYNDILNYSPGETDTGILCAVNIFRIDSIMKSEIHDDVRLNTLISNQKCIDSKYSDYYKKRQIYYSILKSFNGFSDLTLSEGMQYRDSYEYAMNLSEERKSPFIGAFSGIIPGMGYVYAGEPGTGLAALIVITAGSAITWGAHINNLEPLAAVSGATTFFMYSGSIAGGYIQTVKYNRGLSEKLVVRLDKDFMLDKDRDEIYIKCGIESNVR